MLTVIFTEQKPMYLELYEEVVRSIKEKRLKSGEKLPSRRALAKHLGVSLNTVINAYDQLLQEGYIISKERSGYYIDKINPYHLSQKKNTEKPLKTESKKETFLSSQGPPSSFLENREILGLLKDSYEEGLRDPEGLKRNLKGSISHFLENYRGIHVDSEGIILTRGHSHSLSLLFNILSEKDYGIEDPGYKKTLGLFKGASKRVHLIPLDKYGVSVKDLEETPAKVLITTPNHQFPTGIVMGVRRRQRLLQWAIDKKAWIIEDDYDSLFKYKGKHIPSIKSLDREERVILSGSLSLLFGEMLRISYLVLPKKLLELYKKLNLTEEMSLLDQSILEKLFSENLFDKHLSRLQTNHKAVRDRLIKELKMVGEHLEIDHEDLGSFFLISLDEKKLSMKTLKERAREENIELYSLQDFTFGRTLLKDQVILSYGSMDKLMLETRIEQIKKLFQQKR